jgi:small-conductance mechanosensitive channel
MTISTWSEVLTLSFQNLWYGVVGFVPNLLAAIIIVLVGWGIGAIFGRVVSQIIKSIKVDDMLRRAGVEDFLNKGGLELNSGDFLGALVKWFVMLVFLIGAFEILKLNQVTAFLRDILDYLPQVIVAVIILIAAGMVADVMKRVVQSSAMTAGVSSSGFLATITKWVIWVFAILVALSQLGIASAFIQTIFTGLIVALSLGLGLAFGLGGQEAASKLIEKVGKEISDKR